ncbi:MULTISPECIES: LacI family DNA-binding transcriptional regulator [Gammaproteobacteria]|uniref:LacI family DNA-binding transcriptional regulator n=1 Tax=Gammaproteobacteria TaxID=1236 RepID=UPI000DCFC788|nr:MULTISPECIES: LacI family DNA-binding transcriptional regulator [Gammaproteobacteria]RTE86292.1 LacI family DNA-binding transcriptional regulator [Aliidiomarina sp. B3213]TCZ91643.1 LacI family DNA-binding transcriptional regulator [Lysobacter sp. N42]
MATIYEVAKLAGVSLATISRVINQTAPVRESTKIKVEAAMKELGYRPNSVAQSLATNRSNSVGILVSELGGPFYSELISRIEAEFRNAGKHVIIAAGHSHEEVERERIEFLMSRNCDALILHVESVSDEYLQELAEQNKAFVIINRSVAALSDRCITLDNQLGGYLATEFLLRKGHKRIAYISGPMWKNDASERYKGHLQALKEYHIEEDISLFYEGDFQETGGVHGFAHLSAKHSKHSELGFTALVCGNDEMAAGAMAVAHDRGLDIPHDLSIVGFDNVNFSHYTYPKLTTIDYPIAEIGQMAARWVLKHVYKQDIERIQSVFKPRLMLRDSC